MTAISDGGLLKDRCIQAERTCRGQMGGIMAERT